MLFERYQHINRLGTTSTKGVLDGKCYIFPKIDGTNASVWLNNNGEIACGSRNREISVTKDNQGFASYIESNLGSNIKEYLHDHPNHRLYMEWLVPHTIKTYNNEAWRKPYVFDVIEYKENGERESNI